jgi:hypothetical protein
MNIDSGICDGALSKYFPNGICRSLWLDESHGVLIAAEKFGDIATYLATKDCHPPFYYLLLHYWFRIFGVTELTSRGFSFFCTFLTAGVIWAIGSKFSRRAGTLAAMLYLGSPLIIGLASFARMYTLLHFMTAVSSLVLLSLIQNPRNRRLLVIYALLATLGLLTHYYFFMVLAAQGLALLVSRSPRLIFSVFIAQLAGLSIFAVLWSEAFLYQLSPAVRASDHSEGVFFYTPIWTALQFYGGLKGIAIYGAVGAIFFLFRDSPLRQTNGPAERQLLRYLVIFSIMMLVVPWAASYFRGVYFLKAAAIGAIPLTILIGNALSDIRRPVVALLFAGLLLCANIGKSIQISLRPEQYRERDTAKFIADRSGANDLVIATSLSYSSLYYYLLKDSPEVAKRLVTYPAEIKAHPGWRWDIDRLSETKLRDDAARIRASLNQNRSLFILDGEDEDINRYLVSALDGIVSLSHHEKIEGGFHRFISVYSNLLATPDLRGD